MSDNDFRGRDDARDEFRREERSGRGGRRGSYDDQDDRPRGRRGGGGFSDDQDDRGRGQARGRRSRRRKEDFFEASGTQPNYKDVDTLRRFLTDRAKIRPRRQTGLSSTNQRRLALEIKRARHLALLPFTDDQLRR